MNYYLITHSDSSDFFILKGTGFEDIDYFIIQNTLEDVVLIQQIEKENIEKVDKKLLNSLHEYLPLYHIITTDFELNEFLYYKSHHYIEGLSFKNEKIHILKLKGTTELINNYLDFLKNHTYTNNNDAHHIEACEEIEFLKKIYSDEINYNNLILMNEIIK